MRTGFYRGMVVAIVIIALLVAAAAYYRWTGQLPGPLLAILIHHIQLPAGVTIQLYATGVPNVRSLALGAHLPRE